MSEYQKKANNFLDKFGITFEAVRAVPQTCPTWWSKCESYKFHPEPCAKGYVICPHNHGLQYSMQLTRTATGKTLIFPFWSSINDTYKQAALKVLRCSGSGRMDEIPWGAVKPTTYDALACMSGDAHIHEMQFDEYCAEYGYSNDSIKAKESYDYSCKFSREISRFFTADELMELQEIQ